MTTHGSTGDDDGAPQKLPRRTPGATPIDVRRWPVGNDRTVDAPPDDLPSRVFDEQFVEDRADGGPPYRWHAYTWWLHGEVDPVDGHVPGDRLTIGRYIGPPYVHNVGPERFTLLTSSRSQGVTLREMFGYTPGIGDAVTADRDDLIALGHWLIETFGAESDRPPVADPPADPVAAASADAGTGYMRALDEAIVFATTGDRFDKAAVKAALHPGMLRVRSEGLRHVAAIRREAGVKDEQ